MEEDRLPVENEIRRYTEDKDYYGFREIQRHLDGMGYNIENGHLIKILNGLCQEGHSVFLGWHGSNAIYQRVD